ncbi:APC amino acid permease [Clavulina sp. PMI_390]|nr:APC amino acid permease [Clavulina sp. PMI_390]
MNATSVDSYSPNTSLPGIPVDKDDKLLEAIGVHRELSREFTSWSTISFALSILGCVASIASTFNTPLLYGGPAAAVWSWFMGSWGCLAIAVSVAELVSAYPSSSGVYGAPLICAPPLLFSIVLDYPRITVVGQLATPASVNFAGALMIFAAVTISTDGSFVPSTGQVLGLYCGINILMGIYNSLPSKILDKMFKYWMWINLLTSLAVIIAVPAGASHKGILASSKFVWTEVVDGTGWGNAPFAFLLGILSVQWVMTDYDGAAHLAEEVKNAAVIAPVAIVIAVISTGFIGFWINVALCYGIQDLSALPGATGLVFSQILWDSLGKRGALALWSFVIIIQVFTGLACQLACIRSIYAVSRDGAFPDRKLMAKVWGVTKTPVNAAIFTVVIQCLFGLLYLISYVAINAVFSITAVALDVSYMIPTIGKLYLYFYPSEHVKFVPGPFYLGKWGYVINVYAILWTLFETGILIMPQVRPVTANTMNYAGPIMGGTVLVSGIWYIIYGVSFSFLSMALLYFWRTYRPASAVVGGMVRSPDAPLQGAEKGTWDSEEKTSQDKGKVECQ